MTDNPQADPLIAAVERVRRLHDSLNAETDLTSPDDQITRGAAARRIAAALDGWSALTPVARQAASTAPLAAGLPLVQGRCPACQRASLFLGSGGYVTCSSVDCPEPDAATTVLEGDANWPAVRAAVLREAADRLTQVPFTNVLAELRRMADCHACEAGIEHDVHCPTPETHNWGCGCPTDPVPADGPSRMADEAQQPETQAGCGCPNEGAVEHQFGVEDCTCIPFVREGGTARYCQPGDTVDQISGWERGGDCPHHRKPAAVSQPGKEG